MQKTILFAIIILLTAVSLTAQTTFKSVKSDIKIEGTSSLHDWVSEVTKMDATGKFTVEDGKLAALNELNVKIKVEGIESGKGVMDKKTYKALDSDDNPFIKYQLLKVNSMKQDGNKVSLQTAGNLTIAGATRKVDLQVQGQILSNGNIAFTGSKALKMTDFKVDPPTALLGTLKTGDDVTIKFSLTMANSGTDMSRQ